MTDQPTPEDQLDAAYRERAHLVALLAAMTDGAVIAPAKDVEEPGWQIAYLKIGKWQASWHIAPRDADLFRGVEHVDTDDPRALWDGHSTDQKYTRIRMHTRVRQMNRRLGAGREQLPASTAPLAAGLPLVQGRCPACGHASLFLGDGGHVTCSIIDCPNPCAVDEQLHGEPTATPATGPREHCGNLKPQFSESADRTECVLRPGHSGSHADHDSTRWWWTSGQTTPTEEQLHGEPEGK